MDTDASRVDQHLLRYSLAELSQHDGSPIARHAILTILHLVRDELQLETLALVTKTGTGWWIRYQIDEAGATALEAPVAPWLAEVCQAVGPARQVQEWRDVATEGDAPSTVYTVAVPIGELAERWILCLWGPAGGDIPERLRERLVHFTELIGIGLVGDILARLRDRRFDALMAHLEESITILGPDGSILYESPAARAMLNYPSNVLESSSPEQLIELIHPDDRNVVVETMQRLFATPSEPVRSQYRVRHADGSWRWLSAFATNLIAEPAVGGIVNTTTDVTQRKGYEEQLEYESSHDLLTGLLNRTAFVREITTILDNAKPIAVLFIDLNNFRWFNNSYGHSVGDDILQTLGRRFLSMQASGEITARFGGDEFAIAISGPNAAEAQVRAHAYLAQITAPFIVRGQELTLNAAIGIALAPEHGTDFDRLYRAADLALYRIKHRRDDRIAVYDPDLDAGRDTLETLGMSFVEAVGRGEIQLHYQPIRDLETGEILAAEGLARWYHPERGILGPLKFIPIIEELGLCALLAKVTLRLGADAARKWGIPVAINLSADQLRHPEIVTDVARVLETTCIEPNRLIVEVTESIATGGDARALEAIASLRRMGLHVAVDDFGTGYSGLASLRDYEADSLKIDQRFVELLNGDRKNHAVIRAVLAVSSALGMSTIAEGIETEEQVQQLRALGCKVGQGFLLGRPMAAESFFELIKG